jgi:hypothetical protein
MPMELAYSLATLALYDIIIYADDSGSMAFEEGGERIQDLKLMVGRVADVATLFDDDGILVRFMNGTTEGNGIRDSMSAGQLISQVCSVVCHAAGTKTKHISFHENGRLGCFIPGSIAFAVMNSKHLLDSMSVGQFGLSARYVKTCLSSAMHMFCLTMVLFLVAK